MDKKLSSNYAGSATREKPGFDKEVESRLSKQNHKRMDVFTNEFQYPGFSQSSPGQDNSKANSPYQTPHTDFPAEVGADGTISQEEMDRIDEEEGQTQARFDPYLARRDNMAKMAKDEKIDGPESFHKAVEKKMKRLQNKEAKAAKIESEYQKDPAYNPDEDDSKDESLNYNL
jgi:hypothetical protein